ncbi:bile acid-CoA:amino acid N-acyltransferase-like [Diadema setosum]|uniref:bile acid-CoA:amino acid N-acyltransferase-like n=1 Tax=Diadema setosum TaxID=31175 RepID=UPI003B3AFC3C
MMSIARLRILLRQVPSLQAGVSVMSRRETASSSVTRECTDAGPILSITPESGLADELMDIRCLGLQPGQLVTLTAKVRTENGKYEYQASGQYRAAADGTVKVQTDPSLGGSYQGVEPMGLLWSQQPVPEVAHKHPRLVKFDVTRPFTYTFELHDGQGGVLASKVVERTYVADYVEKIPVSTGEAEGVLFLPEKREGSDPLPFVVDMRGLLTRLVVDRAALLASHGFAVFAFDYFLPRRLKTKEENVYMDSQAFLDVIKFAREHPRLDADRIGITSSCYGGSMMLHSVTRLQLPVRCMVAAGFSTVLSVQVGWKNLDGSLIDPIGPMTKLVSRWKDENDKWWLTFNAHSFSDLMEGYTEALPIVENINCPLLAFRHEDDKHIPSIPMTTELVKQMKEAGKGHLVELQSLPGTGHFLECPYQAINTVSSLYNPGQITTGQMTLYYTDFGGEDIQQGAKDQEFAWRKIINFFRKHLKVEKMYRTDWISD